VAGSGSTAANQMNKKEVSKMTFNKIIFMSATLLGVSTVNAAVINEAAFIGTEYLETFNAPTVDGTQSTSTSINVPKIDFSTFSYEPMTISVPNTPNLYGYFGFDLTNCCDSLFDNYASASLNGALRIWNDDAVITIDLPDVLDLITLDRGVNRVGGLLSSAGDPSSQWLVTTYDSLFNEIESATFFQPAIDDAVFFGFESETDIARITIDKTAGVALNYIFLDDIRFESVNTVPVPSAVWLFGSGLLGLIGVARREKA